MIKALIVLSNFRIINVWTLWVQWKDSIHIHLFGIICWYLVMRLWEFFSIYTCIIILKILLVLLKLLLLKYDVETFSLGDTPNSLGNAQNKLFMALLCNSILSYACVMVIQFWCSVLIYHVLVLLTGTTF